MIPSAPHPDEVLRAILATGKRSDKAEKLRKLNELCATEYNRHSQGARDFTLANIARIAEIHGLFMAKSIYTNQSKDYAALVKAWEAYNGPKQSALVRQQQPQSDKYEFLERIEDPAVRALCHMGLVERDRLKVELNLCKSMTEVTVDLRKLDAKSSPSDSNVAIVEVGAQLTEKERKALTAAIDPKVLAKEGWQIGRAGCIETKNGRMVQLPGYATAIARILGKPITPALGVKEDEA
jgi:hypothetical protein